MPMTPLPAAEILSHDEPEVLRRAAADDFSLHAVPPTWRSSTRSLSMAWFALMSAMFWLVLGSTVSLTVGTVDTLVGIALSVVACGVICDAASRYAARTGTSVALFSRALFGQVGATFAALLLGVTIVYYAVANGSIVAIAFHEYVGGLPLELWYLVVVLYSAPLVMRGVRTWLDKVNAVLLPLYVAGLIACVIWAGAEHGFSGEWLTYVPPGGVDVGVPGWWFAFTVYMGVWVVVMMTWDYARFGRTEDARTNGRVIFGIPFFAVTLLVNGAIGIFVAHTIPIEGALSETTAILGIVALMGPFGIVLIWASQTRINTANFYLSSSNFQSFFARACKITLPRTAWTAIVGALVFLIMLADVFAFLLEALRFQGVIIVAWVAIAMTHVAWTHLRGRAPEAVEFRPGRVPLLNPGGLAAWGLSSAAGIVLLAAAGSFGATWAPPITLAIGAVLYAISLERTRGDRSVPARPHDPRDEVAEPWSARIRCHRCGLAYIAHEMDRDPARGHAPICLACASGDREFLRAARAEARAMRAGADEMQDRDRALRA